MNPTHLVKLEIWKKEKPRNSLNVIYTLPFPFSIPLLFHRPFTSFKSNLPPPPCATWAATLWPCHRIEKREGIITCHLADNGIPWSIHLFPFKDLCRKTTADAARRMFGRASRAWAQIYVFDIYHSYRFGSKEVETGVSLFPRFSFGIAQHHFFSCISCVHSCNNKNRSNLNNMLAEPL